MRRLSNLLRNQTVAWTWTPLANAQFVDQVHVHVQIF